MEFDKTAPGGGVIVTCRVENGKAFLEWKFYVVEKEGARTAREQNIIKARLIDRQGNLVLECLQALQEEEPLESILLQPHLWQAVTDPYLYKMEAVLMDNRGRNEDCVCVPLPLRSIKSLKELQGEAKFCLNGMPFVPRAVSYFLPFTGSKAQCQRLMLEDLQQLLGVGANCICLKGEEESGGLFSQFSELCDRFGFLVLMKDGNAGDGGWVCSWDKSFKIQNIKELPEFRGIQNSFFPPEGKCPTSLFYKYKAVWSQEPFVYLAPESIQKLRSGNYAVCCYSNCSKVALYTDGVLFEFQRGQGEFIFREIPAKSPCIMLAAEGDGCSTALSIHKMLVRP